MLLKMHGANEELREEEDSSTCDHNHESAHTSNLLAWSYLDCRLQSTGDNAPNLYLHDCPVPHLVRLLFIVCETDE